MHERDRRSLRTQGRTASYPSPSTNFHSWGNQHPRTSGERVGVRGKDLVIGFPPSPGAQARRPLPKGRGGDSGGGRFALHVGGGLGEPSGVGADRNHIPA